MSHSLPKEEITTLTSPCAAAPTNLEIGQEYRIAAITQGSITFDVIALAIATNVLSDSVKVQVVGAPLTQDGWRGIIDYADCQLVYLENNFNNEVWGKTNIGVFPWLSSSYSGNKVAVSATFTPDATGTGIVRNNTLMGTGTLNLSAAPATINVTNNLISGTLTVANPASTTVSDNQIFSTVSFAATAGPVTFSNNIQGGAGIINLQAANTHSIIRNAFFAFSTITSFVGASGGTLTVQDTVLNNGRVDFNVAVYRPTFINNSFLADGGFINFTAGALWNNTGNTTITRATLLSQATISMNGGDAADASISINNYVGTLSGTLSFDSGTSSVLNVQNHNGTLITAGFNAIQVKIEAASSTLIADASLAQKSGYVGVLP